MAISTIGTYLGWADVNDSIDSYDKITDIKDFSDLSEPPEGIETTTMSDTAQTFIQGLVQQSAVTFTLNFEPEDYAKIEKVGQSQKAVCLLLQNNCLFKCAKAQFSITVAGGSVNEVVNATLTVTPAAKWELAGSWADTTWTKESWYYHDDTKKITKIAPAA